MPDSRKHRGQHPNDVKLFAPAQVPNLQAASYDHSWLLSRQYPEKAALKLVGDRYRLTDRQRKAVMRSSCSDEALTNRKLKMCAISALKGQPLTIDGYNLLITIESALSKAYLFEGRDHSFRDLASIHGTYRRVEETIPAIELIAQCLHDLEVAKVDWYFDSPVSNSGRLKVMIYELVEKNGWNWNVTLVHNPDRELIEKGLTVVSSDSMVMDESVAWVNLARYIVENYIEIVPNQIVYLSDQAI